MWLNVNLLQGPMITRRIPALLLALSPFWVSASVYAEEVIQVDPVTAIDEKMTTKQTEIDAISAEYEAEGAKLQQLKNEHVRIKRESEELDAKRNRAKSALDKQYSRLLDDPDTDLASFQKKYQETWASVKQNQAEGLENNQAMTEVEMRLSQIKQKQARLSNEYANLEESRIEARVKRLEAELRESSVLETGYKTTCSTTMTLGECSNQGQHLTKQKAVKTFRAKLLDDLTESVIAKQNLKGVELNIHVQDSQIIRSGFEGNNEYFTQMQAQLQAKPEAVAACKLLNVSTRYCLKGGVSEGTQKNDKQWANVTVRSDQYNDAVTINGINYGSTPVEIVLPNGRHQVTVSKDGYETYNRVLTINGNDTVWIKLRPNKEG
ncbi:PEGA domain-containing protein [Vibrio anguillarum]|uniref:PEGA domain-containing protein n=4 Tax=Vibrio TaxID=662 RepID=A0A241PBD8_VIBAN|nr:chromosome partitioning protein ParA [Vibrio anguillarum]MDF9387379.1 PEGA domain-containing protein [Vibrio sp. 1151_11]MDQ2190015.1 PEGA domain-containing protein [Vibrio sp. A14(2019)]MDQ2195793.1 PEGA domain-containing protein [Vibrio sp. 2017_1457_11]NAX17287.1 PEGA domain-containing protein [Vibrio sp. V22_P2S10T140]NAX44396.1 PEGA domain-containing protein [Vibrio sp. V25_P4S6T154]NNN48296.1 PEGA domain-containing protein [Vibrio sp. 2-2(8)]NNN68440.1 PEGA domain-containing protein